MLATYFYFSYNLYLQSLVDQWWPVEARVIESFVKENKSYRQDGYGSTTYHPEIRYTYKVEGEKFESSNYSFSATWGSGTYDEDNNYSVKKIVNRYPPNSITTAYFNPDDNSMSVLDNGSPRWLSYKFIILTIFLGGMGSLLFFVALVGRKSEPKLGE